MFSLTLDSVDELSTNDRPKSTGQDVRYVSNHFLAFKGGKFAKSMSLAGPVYSRSSPNGATVTGSLVPKHGSA